MKWYVATFNIQGSYKFKARNKDEAERIAREVRWDEIEEDRFMLLSVEEEA